MLIPPLQARVDELGFFLTRHAIEHGVERRELARSVARGELVRIRHGSYSTASAWASADDATQHRIRVRSTLARSELGHVVSHHSAAIMHTNEWWGFDLSQVHVTGRRRRGARAESGVTHHRGELPDAHVRQVEGLQVVSPARCALEVAATSGTEPALVLMDSLLREEKVTPAELESMLQVTCHWPGSLASTLVVRLANGASGSVGESRCRHLFWRLGLPQPVLQHPVYDGREVIALLDFWWPESGLAGEFDGRAKYGRLLRDGESASDAVYAEKLREDRIREILQCRFIRYRWWDLEHPAQMGARTRDALRPPGRLNA